MEPNLNTSTGSITANIEHDIDKKNNLEDELEEGEVRDYPATAQLICVPDENHIGTLKMSSDRKTCTTERRSIAGKSYNQADRNCTIVQNKYGVKHRRERRSTSAKFYSKQDKCKKKFAGKYSERMKESGTKIPIAAECQHSSILYSSSEKHTKTHARDNTGKSNHHVNDKQFRHNNLFYHRHNKVGKSNHDVSDKQFRHDKVEKSDHDVSDKQFQHNNLFYRRHDKAEESNHSVSNKQPRHDKAEKLYHGVSDNRSRRNNLFYQGHDESEESKRLNKFNNRFCYNKDVNLNSSKHSDGNDQDEIPGRRCTPDDYEERQLEFQHNAVFEYNHQTLNLVSNYEQPYHMVPNWNAVELGSNTNFINWEEPHNNNMIEKCSHNISDLKKVLHNGLLFNESETTHSDNSSSDVCYKSDQLTNDQIIEKIQNCNDKCSYRELRYYTLLYMNRIGFHDINVIRRIGKQHNELRFHKLKEISMDVVKNSRSISVETIDNLDKIMSETSFLGEINNLKRIENEKDSATVENDVNKYIASEVNNSNSSNDDSPNLLDDDTRIDKMSINKVDFVDLHNKLLVIKENSVTLLNETTIVSNENPEFSDYNQFDEGNANTKQVRYVDEEVCQPLERIRSRSSSSQFVDCETRNENSNNVYIRTDETSSEILASVVKQPRRKSYVWTKSNGFNCRKTLNLLQRTVAMNARTKYRMRVSCGFRKRFITDVLRRLTSITSAAQIVQPITFTNNRINSKYTAHCKPINRKCTAVSRRISEGEKETPVIFVSGEPQDGDVINTELHNSEIAQNVGVPSTTPSQKMQPAIKLGSSSSSALLCSKMERQILNKKIEKCLSESWSSVTNCIDDLKAKLNDLIADLNEKATLYKQYDTLVSVRKKLKADIAEKQYRILARRSDILHHYNTVMKLKDQYAKIENTAMATASIYSKPNFRLLEENKKTLTSKLTALMDNMNIATSTLQDEVTGSLENCPTS